MEIIEAELMNSAYSGNTQKLRQILTQTPLILHNPSLLSPENPLHVASMAGHVEFVKEALTRNPDLATQLNQDGFTPLHLASANGFFDVVVVLVAADPSLSRIPGREDVTALHVAAIRGKVDVLRKLLSACPKCVEDVTAQKESALHLAVRYGQFEALKAMVVWVKEMEMEDLVFSMKDAYGNTGLHLATWRKQSQVVELLLGNGSTKSSFPDINAINQSGLTSLDLLLMFPSEAGDREIGDTLRSAGAMRAKDVTNSSRFDNRAPEDRQTSSGTSRSTANDLIEYFRFKRGRDSPSDARTSLLVISVFVATTTFQVGLNPPGGIWQDNGSRNNDTNNQLVQTPGRSIFGSQDLVCFTIFLIFNTIGFTMSLSMVEILTKNFPLKLELEICLGALFVTYGIAIGSIAPKNMNTFLTVLSSTLPTLLPLGVTWLLRSHIIKIKDLLYSRMCRIRSQIRSWF